MFGVICAFFSELFDKISAIYDKIVKATKDPNIADKWDHVDESVENFIVSIKVNWFKVNSKNHL